MIENNIDTGDTVLHVPSQEEWIVAFVSGDYLCPCGWPLCYAKLSDCKLVEKADSGRKLDILNQMARCGGDDPRRHYAIDTLDRQEKKLSEYTTALIDKVEREAELESVIKKHEVRKYQY